MNNNPDQFQELSEIRRQRRTRAYIICFTMFAMISVMNMLSVSQQSQYQVHQSSILDTLQDKSFQQLIQYLQLVQPEYEIGVQNIIDVEYFLKNQNKFANLDGETDSNNNSTDNLDDLQVKQIEGNNEQEQIIDSTNNSEKYDEEIQNDQNKETDQNQQNPSLNQKLTKSQKKQLQKARLQYLESTDDNKFFQENIQKMTKIEKESYEKILIHIKTQQISMKEIVRHLFKKLSNKSLEGDWVFQNDPQKNGQQFLEFDNQKGFSSAYVYYFSLDSDKVRLDVQFNDGQFLDQKRLYTELEIDRNTKIKHKLASSSISIYNGALYQIYNKSEKSSKKEQQDCSIDMNLNFGIKQQQNKLKIDFYSEQCGIDINVILLELNHSSYWKQALIWALIITGIAVTHIIGAVKTLKNIIQSPQDGPKYSIVSLAFIFIWDGFFSGSHLIFSISDYGAFQYLMPGVVLFMVLWLVFERTLMLEVWKIQNQASIQTEEALRKNLMWFHGKIYGAMILFMIIGKMYIYEDWFFISINCYLFFQIITNAMRGQQSKPDNNFIWMLLVPRSFVPLYIKGCPYNIYKLHSSAFSFFAILALLSVQIGLIYAQQYYGTRFFIPSIFLPQQYNYFENMPQNLDIESGIDEEFTQECTICFMALHMNPGVDLNQDNSQNTPYFRRLKKKKNQIMRTPCNHRFHIVCLANWMNIKMECPTCRAILPPL